MVPPLGGSNYFASPANKQKYYGYPVSDKEHHAIAKHRSKALLDKIVVIQNEDSFYLLWDGRAKGNNPQFAWKCSITALSNSRTPPPDFFRFQ